MVVTDVDPDVTAPFNFVVDVPSMAWTPVSRPLSVPFVDAIQYTSFDQMSERPFPPSGVFPMMGTVKAA
jgi:hypothetical protein